MVSKVQNYYFQGRKFLNKDVVKELDAILVLKIIGDDCGTATWVLDAKHGEGNITLNGTGLDN